MDKDGRFYAQTVLEGTNCDKRIKINSDKSKRIEFH
jgi:hypothetical protein